jgi:hypothetical protein
MRSFRLLPLALVSASVQSNHAFAVVNHPPAAYQQVTAYETNKKSMRAGVVTQLEAIGGLTEAWDTYNAALKSDPLIVKSMTSFVILGAADFAGQALEKVQSGSTDKKDVDLLRAARFAIFGLVLVAPWSHFYYLLLDGQIPPTEEPFSNTNIVKVCIDQFIQAPIFVVCNFLFLGALEGKGLEDIKKQLKDDYPETIVANCEYCRRVIGTTPKPLLHCMWATLTHIAVILILSHFRCRETLGSSNDHQHGFRSTTSASSLPKRYFLLLVYLLVARTQQARNILKSTNSNLFALC